MLKSSIHASFVSSPVVECLQMATPVLERDLHPRSPLSSLDILIPINASPTAPPPDSGSTMSLDRSSAVTFHAA